MQERKELIEQLEKYRSKIVCGYDAGAAMDRLIAALKEEESDEEM